MGGCKKGVSGDAEQTADSYVSPCTAVVLNHFSAPVVLGFQCELADLARRCCTVLLSHAIKFVFDLLDLYKFLGSMPRAGASTGQHSMVRRGCTSCARCLSPIPRKFDRALICLGQSCRISAD